MTFEVRTPIYEGPLDLLLQLITSHRLEVTDLSLSDLVAEYLAHVEVMKTLDLEVTSEFLVIAATLVQLKARSLLPGDTEVDLDEDLLLAEERDRLLSRLLANLTFKDVAAVLAHRLESTELLVPRYAGLDDTIDPPPSEVRLSLGVAEFSDLAQRVLARPVAEPDLDHLDLDLPSVTEAMTDLRRRLDTEIETDFERVTAHLGRPVEVVAYFLAVLELARWGLVQARQSEPSARITLRRMDGAGGDLVSEWDRPREAG
ncbi:MAG TPA: ScpA family protein [Acidimicrobiia bacterium]|nr:ScpA family protein [Acidimicrobiia bacterium]